MLGTLSEQQINNLLLSQSVGRLACVNGKKPYIVPVTYVYDGKVIIGQTREGEKLNFLRKNPNVCFEVDTMTDMANWQCVLVHGKFVELTGREAENARSYLFNRIMHLMTSATVHPHEHGAQSDIDDSNRVKPVMYKIEIKDKTGRFENQQKAHR